MNVNENFFFFRARVQKGIAWHIDASSVAWTLINSGKSWSNCNIPLFRYFYNHLSNYTKTIIRLKLVNIGEYSPRLRLGEYIVNKPLQAAGMSADNVRGWEIVRKMNIWPRSEASRANVRFWGQSLSQGHYQPTYQQARKGLIYFISLPLIFNSQNFKTARKHGKKSQWWSDGECSWLTCGSKFDWFN